MIITFWSHRIIQALSSDQIIINVFANDDSRLIYILHIISQHVFTFLWILLLCWSDALPHLSRRVKIGALLLCEVHLLIGWLHHRFGSILTGAPVQWYVLMRVVWYFEEGGVVLG